MVKRILVVDDEADIAELVAVRLTSAGYEAVVVNSGKECLARAAAEKFDLVIMDVSMPEIDGIAAACRLKRDAATRDIPVIFLTAMTTKDELGADHAAIGGHIVMAKPYDANDLLAVVKQQINGK